MTASNFQAALAFTLSQEGGWSDRADDPGGPTNQGITLATWQAVWGDAETKDDLRRMTDAQRDAIYRARYWNETRADDLPAGVDLAVFDLAVNAGPGVAGKMLQHVVGAVQDGDIGPLTIAAARAADPQQTITLICGNRIVYYQSLKRPEFIDGWTARANACETAAQALLNGGPAG